MYSREVAKTKTAAKTITYSDASLKKAVLDTVRRAADLVGSTLGPNGKIVLIERQENLPPFATKDGITVFNSMAFSNPTAQAILEAARDSSAKTNTEAGDGTTTATILMEAIIRTGFGYIEKNQHLSPQKIMRELEDCFRELIQPFVKENSLRLTSGNGDDLLRKVSMIATNNDAEMTDAVLECFSLVGHKGNVTIAESSGVSGFEVEKIEGFPIARGFEETTGRFLEEFINDRGNYRTVLERPWFILYNGKLNDLAPILPIIGKIGEQWESAIKEGRKFSPNVVVVAHHFSDQVLSVFASAFKDPSSLNVVPLKTYMTQQANSPYHFLVDLAHFTGAQVFDPLTRPLDMATMNDIGLGTMEMFEGYRYRSTVYGRPDEALILGRVAELTQQASQAESILDSELLQERIAILTGGIARLKVLGSSEAELKEKRHRVEDAVGAIKGALQHGALPGGAKTLLYLSHLIDQSKYSEAVKTILGEAFLRPFVRLLENGGYNMNEISDVYHDMMFERRKRLSFMERILVKMKVRKREPEVLKSFFNTYDALNHKFGDAVEIGVLDSASAVLGAIKNSLAVSKMLMTLSGTVVFKRDAELDADAGKSYSAEQTAMEEAVKQNYREQFEAPF